MTKLIQFPLFRLYFALVTTRSIFFGVSLCFYEERFEHNYGHRLTLSILNVTIVVGFIGGLIKRAVET